MMTAWSTIITSTIAARWGLMPGRANDRGWAIIVVVSRWTVDHRWTVVHRRASTSACRWAVIAAGVAITAIIAATTGVSVATIVSVSISVTGALPRSIIITMSGSPI